MFITFEGGEGSGKSTIARRLKERLAEGGTPVLLTREPGGSILAEKIRNLLVQEESEGMEIKTEVLLFAAARHEHLKKRIIPALQSGATVVCDRFSDSSFVYQGMNEEMDGMAGVMDINRYIAAGVVPDVTFFLDIEPEIALERIYHNEREMNRFDEKALSFHERVREGYYKMLTDNRERYVRIDASKSEDEVFEEVWEKLTKRKEEENGNFSERKATDYSTDFGTNRHRYNTFDSAGGWVKSTD